ncbi:hypothetical protein [Planococcus sp. ISL-109]|uniref:hypothetical protein n=1 Tax=Planococcus sp. ISL-109 TaxID=2819166 RepID=UPI001BEAFB27|nr:hypothetical protein [Planococcus sp. ISL-109]MBT2583186.1 hypothetical protein [Planococcus sp. ISL-109]
MSEYQYLAGDYAKSYETYRAGYAIMFDIGKGLSNAVVDQILESFKITASGMEAQPANRSQ